MKMLKPILSEVEQAAQDALVDVGRKVLARSNELVPVDTGYLKKSGRVLVDDLSVRVVYRAPHAHLVHEDLDARHETGQAKFLEAALDDVGVEGVVIAVVGRKLSRG